MVRGLMTDREWAFFALFVIAIGSKRRRSPTDRLHILDAAALQFDVTAKTIAKWVKRFREDSRGAELVFNHGIGLKHRPGASGFDLMHVVVSKSLRTFERHTSIPPITSICRRLYATARRREKYSCARVTACSVWLRSNQQEAAQPCVSQMG
ncbi:hypothetical protein V4R08_01930 [Nitrobacter sp. NHB1]|uniref:hypothetical protein n=1 Tax=Nitrobacter sp. NHB1 TaxID=3119830 RepID=UPI002FFDB9D8